jgi:hypothetical protein
MRARRASGPTRRSSRSAAWRTSARRCRACGGLEGLALTGHSLSDRQLRSVVQAASMHAGVTRLDVSDGEAGPLALRALSDALPRWPRMRDLRVGCTACEPEQEQAIAPQVREAALLGMPLVALTALTRLEVRGLHTTLALERALAHLPHLAHVVLPAQWTAGVGAAVAALPGLRHLEHVGGDGSKADSVFAALARLTALTHLNMSGWEGDLVSLELGRLSELRHLDLGHARLVLTRAQDDQVDLLLDNGDFYDVPATAPAVAGAEWQFGLLGLARLTALTSLRTKDDSAIVDGAAYALACAVAVSPNSLQQVVNVCSYRSTATARASAYKLKSQPAKASL